MKRHLKRLNAPKSWKIARKEYTFTVKPRPGTHPKEMAIPLMIVLRDMLKIASTAREVRSVIQKKSVYVDGIRRKDKNFLLGLMDVLSIEDEKQSYRMCIDTKGMLSLSEIEDKEKAIKPCKIIRKGLVKGAKIQLTLHDGRNIIMDSNEYKTGATLVIGLPGAGILDYLPLEKKMLVLLTAGTYIGKFGVIESIEGNTIHIKTKTEEFETRKDYAFVIGKDVPVIAMK